MGEGEIVTMITSIIAGLYAVVKTIINLIKKFQKKWGESMTLKEELDLIVKENTIKDYFKENNYGQNEN